MTSGEKASERFESEKVTLPQLQTLWHESPVSGLAGLIYVVAKFDGIVQQCYLTSYHNLAGAAELHCLLRPEKSATSKVEKQVRFRYNQADKRSRSESDAGIS